MVWRIFEPRQGSGPSGLLTTPEPSHVSLLTVQQESCPSQCPPVRRAARYIRWLGELWPVIIICLLAVMFTWPLARHPASTLPDLGDPLDSAWRLSWPIHQLRHDPRALLDANTYYPFETTYLFDELILGVALVVAPVTALTQNGVLAVNVALLLAFAGNGLAMYALGRRLTGNRIAALAGALPFAFAPFRLLHLGHVGLSTAFWLPLALIFLDRLLLRPTWSGALLFGLCATMQALSAQYYGFQTVLLVALYLGWALVRRRRWLLQWGTLAHLAFAVVLAEVLLVPVLLPYLGVKGTWAYSRGLEENELHSATATAFLTPAPGTPLGGALASLARGALRVAPGDIWLYPGFGALVLALAGLVLTRHRVAAAREAEDAPSLTGFFLLLLLFGAAMSLGPVLYTRAIIPGSGVTRWMPYRAIFNLVPGFDAMRAPERFGNLFLLGLGGLVSFGVAAILERVDRGDVAGRGGALRRHGRALLVAVLLLAAGAEYWHAPLRRATVPPPPPVYAWLAAQPPGPVLELPLTVPANELNREQLRQYWSTFHWQTRVNGSSDIAPRAYTALREDLGTFPDARGLGILQALGVRYVIVHRAQYTPAEWAALAPRYASYGVTLQRGGEFGDDLALLLQPDERFVGLQRLIPAHASVFLSENDPRGTDAYMATLGWLLRDGDRELITRIIPTFGERYTRPALGQHPEWLILYPGDDLARLGFPPGSPLVYSDNVVRVYRNAPAP
jgi:hypothetical protein